MTHENIRRIREIGEHLVDPELTAQIFEELSDALVLVDSRAVIQLVNHQAELLFGYRRTELYDRPLEILLPDNRRLVHRAEVAAYFREPRRRPMGIGLYLVGRRKDGTEFPCEINLGPIVTHAGTYCVAVVRVSRSAVRAVGDAAAV